MPWGKYVIHLDVVKKDMREDVVQDLVRPPRSICERSSIDNGPFLRPEVTLEVKVQGLLVCSHFADVEARVLQLQSYRQSQVSA